MNPSQQSAVLPAHLQPFVARQPVHYSPRDHAVWRFVLRHLVARLRHSAHPVYREGLAATGIDPERIPAIADIDRCLQRVGWRAVAVDGFIPPAVFMEFQARRVLPIAQAMRRIEHILYTPAPDIVHEAAGHAPFLVDADYAAFLQRFGEVGMRAEASAGDGEVYQAVRDLSVIKESPEAGPQAVAAAERELARCVAANSAPSAAALLSRLHWWTVEYGLVGRVDRYRLFGAGLLSSLGECVNCRDDTRVKKIGLSLDAIHYPYDITREQPQLFVARDFTHLGDVLEQFAGRLPQSMSTAPMRPLPASATRTGLISARSTDEALFALYGELRQQRERQTLEPQWLRHCGDALKAYPDEWLIRLELLELLERMPQPSLQRRLTTELRSLQLRSPVHQRLIGYGLGVGRAA